MPSINLLELVDRIQGALNNVKNPDMRRALKDAAIGISEVHRELMSMHSALSKAESRVAELEKVDEALFSHHHNAMWRKEEDGSESGPYCMRCFSVDRKAVPLALNPADYPGCLECKRRVLIPDEYWRPQL